MKRAMQKFGDEARAAFAKVGVLMASARRTAQALHPTNLHVNTQLFPRDTIQSRLPDPEWLEHWLDTQIQFDTVWENKVVERILHNLEPAARAQLRQRAGAEPLPQGSDGQGRRRGSRCRHGRRRAGRRGPARLSAPPSARFSPWRRARSCAALRSAATFCALGRSPTRRFV